MARRRKWRTTVQQQNPAVPSTLPAPKSHAASNATPTALPIADLRRVSLIVLCLLALLAGIVAYVHAGSNAGSISGYLGRMLHIQS